MCGLLGYICMKGSYGLMNTNTSFAQQALYVGTLRGRDSTGIFSVGHGNLSEVSAFKRAVSGPDFIQMKDANKIISGGNSVLIGHNRAATKGAINPNNAHPFQHEHIIGVHNGTLLSDNGLLNPKEFDTDSEAIFYTLSQKESKDVIPELHGAFALIWYNTKTQKLHVVRNKERTLYCGISEKSKAIYLSSEVEMLDWLCSRNNIKLDDTYQFEVGVEYTFDPNTVPKFTLSEHKLYTPPVKHFHSPVHLPFSMDKPNSAMEVLGLKKDRPYIFWAKSFDKYGHNHKGSKPVYGCMSGVLHEDPYYEVKIHGITFDNFLSKKNKTLSANLIRLDKGMHWDEPALVLDVHTIKKVDVMYVDSHGNTVSHQKWDKLVSRGCANCTIDLMTPANVRWTDNGDPLCVDCYLFLSQKKEAS